LSTLQALAAIDQHQSAPQRVRYLAAITGARSMRAAWSIFGLAAVALAISLALARWLVPDVIPVGYAEEPQASWAVLIAFALRAIEFTSVWVAAIALAVPLGVWARDRLRR
jgi:hypothetical protein